MGLEDLLKFFSFGGVIWRESPNAAYLVLVILHELLRVYVDFVQRLLDDVDEDGRFLDSSLQKLEDVTYAKDLGFLVFFIAHACRHALLVIIL